MRKFIVVTLSIITFLTTVVIYVIRIPIELFVVLPWNIASEWKDESIVWVGNQLKKYK